MRPVRCVQKTFHRLVDRFGGAALMALLLWVVLSTWGVLSAWRQPEPWTWDHAAFVLNVVALALLPVVVSRRERKRLEWLQRQARRDSAIANAEWRAQAAELQRLLPQTRTGDAERRKMRDDGRDDERGSATSRVWLQPAMVCNGPTVLSPA